MTSQLGRTALCNPGLSAACRHQHAVRPSRERTTARSSIPVRPSLSWHSPHPCARSGSQGQLGQPQLHTLHLMQAGANVFVMDVPRKIESLDPNRLQPWKRCVSGGGEPNNLPHAWGCWSR